MDVTSTVAANAREIREHKGLTLDRAAALTGVSRSMLAQIEKGEVNPTISVLWKMANGYKVSFTSLVENRCGTASVLRLSDSEPLAEDSGRYLNYPIFPFDESRLFETYRIVIKAGGALSAQAHLKGAEEYITVFPAGWKSVPGRTASCSPRGTQSALPPTSPTPIKTPARTRRS